MSDTFATRLKQAREARRLTQEALAEKVGMQPSHIGHYEAGTRKPSYDNLRSLCLALRVSGDLLLGLTSASASALRSQT